MLDNTLMIYLISGAAATFIGLVLFVGWLWVKRLGKKASYEEQLKEITGAKLETSREGIFQKWNNHWNRLFDNVGISRRRAGIDVLLITIIAGGVLGVVMKNLLSGFGIAVILLAAGSFFLKNATNKRDLELNKQLPGFIFALKANIEARNIPEHAFLNIVEDVPEPLYTDVIPIKRGLIANRSFSDSLEEMRQYTTSKDLKFLGACIIQATESGGDIEEQLLTIQNILVKQQEINDEIDKGYKTASPVLKLATFLIPGSLIGMILLDEGARDFWFKEPLSWIFFIIIVVLYAISVVYAKKQVDKLRNY